MGGCRRHPTIEEEPDGNRQAMYLVEGGIGEEAC
jgi:hypothetical protein